MVLGDSLKALNQPVIYAEMKTLQDFLIRILFWINKSAIGTSTACKLKITLWRMI
jgi:hypothetical protein